MRIALVSDTFWPRVNGVSASIHTIQEELIRLGHQAIVLCPAYSASDSKRPIDGINRFSANTSWTSPEDKLITIYEMPKFMRTLTRFNPDVIHINTEFNANHLARLFAKLRGHPILMTSHTDYEDYIANYIKFIHPRITRAYVRFLIRLVFRSADVVIVPSKNQMRKLQSYHIHKHYVVIPTGIPGIFKPMNESEVSQARATFDNAHPEAKGKKILLFAGRIGEEKNVRFLIPMFKRVSEAIPEVVLVFAGDGPGRKGVEHLAKINNVFHKIIFLGYVRREELPSIYSVASVFVFPSKTETQGLCTIEAMASGVPVVAIGEMGTLDVMQGDNGGFMVKDNQDEFVAAVLRLLKDPELHEAKSREAVKWAKQFSLEVTMGKLLRLYRQIAAKHAHLLTLRSGIR